MRSLVINLDRSTERRNWMHHQFRQIGATYERVPAVDGNCLTASEVQRYAKLRGDGQKLSAAEVACFLSHRRCWQIIAEGDAPYGAVFEDDVIVVAELAEFLSSHAWIRAGAEIVKLEAPYPEVYRGNENNINRSIRLRRTRKSWDGAAAYVISKNMAEYLVNIDSFDCPVDQFLFDANLEGRCFAAYEIRPGVCIQAGKVGRSDSYLTSTIGPNRMNTATPKPRVSRRAKFFRELRRPFKRFRARLDEMVYTLCAPRIVFRRPRRRL